MKEKAIIEAIWRNLKRPPTQRNRLFESDAEIVAINGQRLAFTIDEFSDEDCMRAENAELLGWNLVAATLSDLLAAGALPLYMLNSLVVAPWMDEDYLS